MVPIWSIVRSGKYCSHMFKLLWYVGILRALGYFFLLIAASKCFSIDMIYRGVKNLQIAITRRQVPSVLLQVEYWVVIKQCSESSQNISSIGAFIWKITLKMRYIYTCNDLNLSTVGKYESNLRKTLVSIHICGVQCYKCNWVTCNFKAFMRC